MTIYILDNDPKKIAEYLDDTSIDVMINDIVHVLCNVHHDILMINYDVVSNRSVEEVELYHMDKNCHKKISFKKVSEFINKDLNKLSKRSVEHGVDPNN